jgi:hypothetical protein
MYCTDARGRPKRMIRGLRRRRLCVGDCLDLFERSRIMVARSLCPIIVVGMSLVATAEETPSVPMILSFKICEKSTDGKGLDFLARPTLMELMGKPFSWVVGQSLKPKDGGEELYGGTRISGTMAQAADGRIRLSAKIELGSIVSPPDDRDTDFARTESLDIRTVLRPGQTKRFEYSDSKWCEIRVEPVSANELPGASSALLKTTTVTK